MNEQLVAAIDAAFADRDLEAAAAMRVILAADGKRVTQYQIAETGEWQRVAPVRVFGIEKRATVERRVREAVRRSRSKYGAPILSCAQGYFMAKSRAGAESNARRIGDETKARVVSMLSTAKRLRDLYQVPNNDPLIALLDEVVALSAKGREVEADTIQGEMRRLRLENEMLRARLAKWGRPPKGSKPGPGQQRLGGMNP